MAVAMLTGKTTTSEGRFGWCLTGHHELCRKSLVINGEPKRCGCSVCNHKED